MRLFLRACECLLVVLVLFAAVFVGLQLLGQDDSDMTPWLQTAKEQGRHLPPRFVVRALQCIVHAVDTFRSWLLPEELRVIELISAMYSSKAYATAAYLGIADVIPLRKEANEQWPTADEIARKMNVTDAEGGDRVYRLMRYLASMGVFKQHPQRRFSHTPLSVLLRSDHAAKAGAMVRSWADEADGWDHLADQIKTGNVSFQIGHGGKDLWQFMNEPEQARRLSDFQAKFDGISEIMTPPLIVDYDWQALAKRKGGDLVVADIGGGLGGVLEAVLEALPQARGILFDQPEVIEQAKAHPRWSPSADCGRRTTLLSGSFLKEVPKADIYTLRMIIHDWNDTMSVQLLKNIKRAMNPDGRVFVIEQVLPKEGGYSRQLPVPVEVIDLHMMALLGAQERTEEQFAKLFEQAGLRLVDITYTRGVFHLICGA